MKRLLLATGLVFSACGGASGEDPCAIPTGALSVHGGQSDASANSLECAGEAAGQKLECTSSVSLEKVACSDGFAFTIESGNATLLLRLSGSDSWKAGARVNGVDLEGSLTMSGLFDPSQPVPPSGQKQKGEFALNSSSATLAGGFTVEW